MVGFRDSPSKAGVNVDFLAARGMKFPFSRSKVQKVETTIASLARRADALAAKLRASDHRPLPFGGGR